MSVSSWRISNSISGTELLHTRVILCMNRWIKKKPKTVLVGIRLKAPEISSALTKGRIRAFGLAYSTVLPRITRA